MDQEAGMYQRAYLQALKDRDEARVRAEKAEARNVELEVGLSTCIGWIATMGVGPRINEVLQDAREALAGKGE